MTESQIFAWVAVVLLAQAVIVGLTQPLSVWHLLTSALMALVVSWVVRKG